MRFPENKAMQTDWENSKGIAKAILHNRGIRRKWLGRWLMLTMCWMAVGLWVIDDWLGGEALRFLVWWSVCAVLACVLMVFAFYDALSVVREEKEKIDE